jgi:hypothetical protein
VHPASGTGVCDAVLFETADMTQAEIDQHCPVNCELDTEFEDWTFDCSV